MHKHHKRHHHHSPVNTDANRPDFLPADARVGDDPKVLTVIQDFVSNVETGDERTIDGYAFGTNPSKDYSNFVNGAHVLLYYWDSRNESKGEYTVTAGDHVLERLAEGKTTWTD